MGWLPDSDFGRRVRARLEEAVVGWLTTVGQDGTPQPNPVWFITDGDEILVYNRSDARRLRHLSRNPRVSLNLDSHEGGAIVVITGEARILPDAPAPDAVADYVAKYGERMRRVSGSLEAFGAKYPVAVRIRPERVRGF